MALEDWLALSERLKEVLINRATGQGSDDEAYRALRAKFKSNKVFWAFVPDCVKTNRDLGDFWPFIKQVHAQYQGRRAYLKAEFAPLFEKLEADAEEPGDAQTPADATTTVVLAAFDGEHVALAWQKALERRASDPEGALTMARTLLEAVCKQILDREGLDYNEKADLPALYGAAAEALKLAPSQHTEKVFKQIMGGCQSVVNGLGTLRTRLGDAHGKSSKAVKPAPRHATLAVNLAGSMATFLVETWVASNAK